MSAEQTDEELELYRMIAAAGIFMPRLEATIYHSEQFNTVYVVRTRIKKHSRLKDKIESKRAEAGRSTYCLGDVSDVIGVRFISLYRRDIIAAISSVLELVAGESPVEPNALRGITLTELKSYTSNSIPDEDAVNIELRSLYDPVYAARTGVPLELIPRSRYSSVHIVLKVAVQHEGAQFVVPIEMQFRSVFEDAWAEIDHQLLYELGRYGQPIDEPRRESIAQHMTILKKLVDTAADYADVIRRTEVEPPEQPSPIPRNLDGVNYIRELVQRAKLPKTLGDELASILTEKTELDDLIERGSAEASVLRYSIIAIKLSTLRSSVPTVSAKSERAAISAIQFSIIMEEALCRLLSNDSGQLRISLDLYRSVVSGFPSFPAGWFRSAQAHQRLADISDPLSNEAAEAASIAFEQFNKATVTLNECRSLRANQRILTISPDQEKYIAKNAARLQGFVRWRLSDRRRLAGAPTTTVDLEDLISAFEVNHKAFVSENNVSASIKLANNSVYYATEAIQIATELGSYPDDLPKKAKIMEMLVILDDVQSHADNILYLDTIVRGYKIVGENQKAVLIARHILDLNSAPDIDDSRTGVSPYVLEATDRAVKFAWTVVRG
jgi:ppGpp synthetase/RelA/SpoT-type nucleotidyltranferase